MSEWTIYYNPKCGSCRKALDLLKSRKVNPVVVEYLKNPPTVAELEAIWDKLGADARDMVRAKEDEFAQEKLGPGSGKREILRAISKHPILLQRPIVVRGRRAIVARPPERAAELL